MKKILVCLFSSLVMLVGCGGESVNSIKPTLIEFVNPEIQETGDEYPYFQSLRALGSSDKYLAYMKLPDIYQKERATQKYSVNKMNIMWDSLIFDYQVAGYAYFYYRDMRKNGFNFKQNGINKEAIEKDWKESFMSLVPIHNKLYIETNGQVVKLENEGVINFDEKSLNDAFDRHRNNIFNEKSLSPRGKYVRSNIHELFYRKKSKRTLYTEKDVRELYKFYGVDGLDYVISRLSYDFSSLTVKVEGKQALYRQEALIFVESRMKKIAQFNFEEYYKTKKL